LIQTHRTTRPAYDVPTRRQLPLLSTQSECLSHRSDSRGVGKGEAEYHFVSAGLDVTCDQAGYLVRLT
jgi:hypothetical protein